jgi:hypothetical protein
MILLAIALVAWIFAGFGLSVLIAQSFALGRHRRKQPGD